MPDQNTHHISLRDAEGRPFLLYGHKGSWSAVYGTEEHGTPATLEEYATAEDALQNIQEPYQQA